MNARKLEAGARRVVAAATLAATALVGGGATAGCGATCSGEVVAVQKLGDQTKLTVRPRDRVGRANCYVTDLAARLVGCGVGAIYPDCT